MSIRLDEVTTLRLGGPAGQVVEARTGAELEAHVRATDAAAEALLLVGGGSNLVVADEGWPGVVLLVRSRGVEVRADADGATLRVQAGHPWDELVAHCVGAGWCGLETMSGIPGSTGATPIQNVGAYGHEVAEVITALNVYDRDTGTVESWDPQRCGFGFRTSAFKHTDRYVVLDVTMRLPRSEVSLPIRYLELARRLGVEPGARVPLAEVREVVLALRASKGMLLDPADHDTWSVGSFFVNPFVAADEVPAGCPHWEVDGAVKLSAAWLIENAGYPRGYGLDRGAGHVSVSTKHTLALTNRGGASTVELLELAAEVRDGVEQRFGVRLRPEARLAGCEF